MSQVLNVLTNRQILSRNAVQSDFHGGFIHSTNAKCIITKIVVESNLYGSFARYTDYVSLEQYESWVTEGKVKQIVTFNRNHNPSRSTIIDGVTIIENGVKYTDVNGDVYYYPMAEGDSVEIFNNQTLPTYALKEVTDLIEDNNVITFKQYKNLWENGGNVPTSSASTFRFGETNRVFMYTDKGRMNQTHRLHIGNDTKSISDSDYRLYSNAMRNSGSGRIFGYHGSTSYRQAFDQNIAEGEWAFGIEAEKQDSLARAYASYLGGRCDGWSAERDSSLSSTSGVEFISPILPLHDGSFVRKNFQEHAWLLNASLDNNDSTDRKKCGGHITISKKGMSGDELLTHLHHFVPLFYSLYIGRLNTNYGGAVRKEVVRVSRKAFNLKSFGVEIRIFSGVPNLEGAWWRVKLLQVMANMIDSGEVNSYKDVANALVTDKHPLRKVMRKMYDSKRIRDKFALVLAFGHMYENGTSRINIDGTSNDVKHKADRVISAFRQFADVRRCTQSVWGIDSISVE